MNEVLIDVKDWIRRILLKWKSILIAMVVGGTLFAGIAGIQFQMIIGILIGAIVVIAYVSVKYFITGKLRVKEDLPESFKVVLLGSVKDDMHVGKV